MMNEVDRGRVWCGGQVLPCFGLLVHVPEARDRWVEANTRMWSDAVHISPAHGCPAGGRGAAEGHGQGDSLVVVRHRYRTVYRMMFSCDAREYLALLQQAMAVAFTVDRLTGCSSVGKKKATRKLGVHPTLKRADLNE